MATILQQKNGIVKPNAAPRSTAPREPHPHLREESRDRDRERRQGRGARRLARAQPEMQRGVTKGVLHKNTVARKLSRLSARIKAL